MKTRGYEMQARAAAAERTGEAILAAAIELFWERPTVDLSLDDVAARAGVSTRTILRKYGSKEGLLAAAGEREMASVGAQRGGVEPGDIPAAISNLLEHYETYGSRVLRLIAASGSSPGLRDIVDQGKSVHQQWCRTVFADHLAAVPDTDRTRRLAQIVAICDVHTWQVMRQDLHLSRPDTQKALTELIHAVVKES